MLWQIKANSGVFPFRLMAPNTVEDFQFKCFYYTLITSLNLLCILFASLNHVFSLGRLFICKEGTRRFPSFGSAF